MTKPRLLALMGLAVLALAAPLYFLTRSEPPKPPDSGSGSGGVRVSEHPVPSPPTPTPPPPPPQTDEPEAAAPSDAAEPPPPTSDAGPRPPPPSPREFMDACRSGDAAKIRQILEAAPAGQRRFLMMQCRRAGADLTAHGVPGDAGTDATP